jgi:hypothetical protein
MLAENWESLNASRHESLSQAFGRALWQLGYAGLLVPSTRDRRGRNLIGFPDNFSSADRIWRMLYLVASGEPV